MSLLIMIVILALVVGVLVWLCDYAGLPGIWKKILVIVGVLIALIMVLNYFGYLHDFGRGGGRGGDRSVRI